MNLNKEIIINWKNLPIDNSLIKFYLQIKNNIINLRRNLKLELFKKATFFINNYIDDILSNNYIITYEEIYYFNEILLSLRIIDFGECEKYILLNLDNNNKTEKLFYIINNHRYKLTLYYILQNPNSFKFYFFIKEYFNIKKELSFYLKYRFPEKYDNIYDVALTDSLSEFISLSYLNINVKRVYNFHILTLHNAMIFFFHLEKYLSENKNIIYLNLNDAQIIKNNLYYLKIWEVDDISINYVNSLIEAFIGGTFTKVPMSPLINKLLPVVNLPQQHENLLKDPLWFIKIIFENNKIDFDTNIYNFNYYINWNLHINYLINGKYEITIYDYFWYGAYIYDLEKNSSIYSILQIIWYFKLKINWKKPIIPFIAASNWFYKNFAISILDQQTINIFKKYTFFSDDLNKSEIALVFKQYYFDISPSTVKNIPNNIPLKDFDIVIFFIMNIERTSKYINLFKKKIFNEEYDNNLFLLILSNILYSKRDLIWKLNTVIDNKPFNFTLKALPLKKNFDMNNLVEAWRFFEKNVSLYYSNKIENEDILKIMFKAMRILPWNYHKKFNIDLYNNWNSYIIYLMNTQDINCKKFQYLIKNDIYNHEYFLTAMNYVIKINRKNNSFTNNKN